MKRFVSIFLVIVMIFCMIPTITFAASEKAVSAADELYKLGLFQGTGTDSNGKPIYDLDRAPTRHEAVVMLVRLLGKDETALAGEWDIPFTDVAAWAKPYVGYAYENGLTNGTSKTTFGGNANITASQYITFVLRALGYDSSEDFKWDKAWEKSDSLGITSGEYNASNENAFLRGDVTQISYNALSAKVVGTNKSLLDKLKVESGSEETGDKNGGTIEDTFMLTDGKPVGPEVTPVAKFNRMFETVDVDKHSYTAQLLDNGYVRFTLEYSSSVNMPCILFNVPEGDLFNMSGIIKKGSHNKIQYDVSVEHIMQTETITIKMFADNMFVNLWLLTEDIKDIL